MCSSGERFSAGISGEGWLNIETDFEACTEHLYVIMPEREAGIKDRSIPVKKGEYRLAGPYEYELDEPNVCLLDIAGYRLDDGEWQEAREILKVDQAVRAKYGFALRGGEMLQPWIVKKINPGLKVNFSSGSISMCRTSRKNR